MSARWRRRITMIGGCWIATVGVLAAAGMRPSPLPLAGIALAIGAAVYLLLDLADVAEPVSWYALKDVSGTVRGSDPRLRSLHRQLARAPGNDTERLHRLLVDVVDDRLLSEYGVDRGAEPERAAHLLGAELSSFVSGQPPRNLAKPTVLASVLTRIEAL